MCSKEWSQTPHFSEARAPKLGDKPVATNDKGNSRWANIGESIKK